MLKESEDIITIFCISLRNNFSLSFVLCLSSFLLKLQVQFWFAPFFVGQSLSLRSFSFTFYTIKIKVRKNIVSSHQLSKFIIVIHFDSFNHIFDLFFFYVFLFSHFGRIGILVFLVLKIIISRKILSKFEDLCFLFHS